MELTVGGRLVAEYVVSPDLEPTLSPRPYLHPIRTLNGTVISDAFPEDHRWHLGLSLAVQDVNGSNLWGGRTYVRDQGYTWLPDHGTITHTSYDTVAPDRVAHQLAWRDHTGTTLLVEDRVVSAVLLDERSWRLSLEWTLTASVDVRLGSPATNGRPGGAGYGGCFLRLAPSSSALVTAGPLTGEDAVNGCTARELLWTTPGYTIAFSGSTSDAEPRWFVRQGMYPGVCLAFAYDTVLEIPAGSSWSGWATVTITDLPL